MKTSRLVLVPLSLALLQAGCGGGPAATSAPSGGAPAVEAVPPMTKVASPKGKTVLRLSPVKAANRSKGVAAFDLATLESMPQTEATVREPFLKRDVRFSGVMLADLLAASGADSKHQKVFMHALDDYTVTLTVDDLRASRALLATRANGKAIPLPKGGPIRVVFLADTKTASNTDMWIWSVDSMRLRG